jgi:predicted lipoprotein with Yx(FWY)xxD motif
MARQVLAAIVLLSLVAVPSSVATAQDIMDPQMGGLGLFSISPHPALGNILADVSGKTLYTWAADSPGTPSVCNDACATAWPPYLLDPSRMGLIDPSQRDTTDRDPTIRISGIQRGDGSYQVALDGWPLYYFSRDAAPGDAMGEGSNGFGARWSVVKIDDMMMGM